MVTGCDERSNLGTFIQVKIKDRMAEIETDDIGELHEKVSVSLNESGIGPDSSDGEHALSTGIACISNNESGIGKDVCSNSICDDIGGFHNLPSDCDRDILGNLGENAELSKNGVIKETDDNNKCKIVCEETNNINVAEKNNARQKTDESSLAEKCESKPSEDGKCANRQSDEISSGMKKDDSGIDFQKSPGKDGTSDNDISESLSESGAMSTKTDSGVALNSQFKLFDNDDSSRESNEMVITQTMDTEDGELTAESCDVTMPSAGTDNNDEMKDACSYTSSDDDEVIVVRTKKNRRRRIVDRQDSSSDNESDENVDIDSEVLTSDHVLDSDDDSDVDEKKSTESESEEEEACENKNLNQTFKAIKDLRNREYGYSNRNPPSYFREKVQGSANLVKRFKLECKLEYHDGCVNALHFNRIGILFKYSFSTCTMYISCLYDL